MSFLYVTDLVEGLVNLMNAEYSYPVNFGNPQHYTTDGTGSRVINNRGLCGLGDQNSANVCSCASRKRRQIMRYKLSYTTALLYARSSCMQ